jgi:hypothetical protein
MAASTGRSASPNSGITITLTKSKEGQSYFFALPGKSLRQFANELTFNNIYCLLAARCFYFHLTAKATISFTTNRMSIK